MMKKYEIGLYEKAMRNTFIIERENRMRERMRL